VESKIVIITPPDKIFNQNNSTLLIYPSTGIKKELQDILAESTQSQNIYIYEEQENHDYDWILTVSKMVDCVILDFDNCPHEMRMLSSYLISLPNTFWLTAEDTLCYSMLSPNRIYGLENIKNLIGGKIEEP